MSRDWWWWLVPACLALGCHGFTACDPQPPIEDLPIKLWSCSSMDKRCEVFARFQTGVDCDLYQRFLGAACDSGAPPGEIHCYPAATDGHRRRWFRKCSRGDLTFAEVHDGGGWIP